ncbi:hypothetical protein [Foetidibacter luteolus]|uniref:hypothetical protein n=1 Tax=Foetidibacter luteolus TaxID=2608880 RepID=UPI00129B47F7|nr:hypothetical protein [Foetidibacter luteolus]
MIFKWSLIFLFVITALSCNKESASKRDNYIVSASKMIRLTGNHWSNAEPQLSDKVGYQYNKAPDEQSNIIKAASTLPAIDDSNRAVNGTVLLNIAPDNTINYAAFDADSLTQTIAYAMMLNYNNESLQTLTGISISIGELVENGMGGNPSMDVVLSKLNSGEEADQLAITHNAKQGSFTMVIFRQSDGSYEFSYRGRP